MNPATHVPQQMMLGGTPFEGSTMAPDDDIHDYDSDDASAYTACRRTKTHVGQNPEQYCLENGGVFLYILG